MWNYPLPTIGGFRKKKRAKDITKDFFEFIRTGQERLDQSKDFSIIVGIIGMRGIGKTFTLTRIIKEFIAVKKDKLLQIWGSEGLANAYSIIFKNVEFIDSIRQIKPNSLLVFDEALLELNGKEALKRKMREFGKVLAILRHVNISAVICSQTLGFIQDLRAKTDLWIIKRLPETAIGDLVFVPKYLRYKISNLDISSAVIVNNYYLFPHKNGIIKIELEDLPEWNNQISRNMESTTLDQEIKKVKDERETIIEYAKEVIKEFGESVVKSNILKKIRGYYYLKCPEEYSELKNHFDKILDVATYLYINETEENKIGQLSLPGEVDPAQLNSFSEFCYSNLSQTDSITASIVKQFLESVPQAAIAKNHEKQVATINKTIKKFRETNMGNLFEDFFNLVFKTGYISPHNTHDPDCLCPENHDLFPNGVISLKCYCDRSNSLTFYQTPPENDKKFVKNFGPEYRYARERNLKYAAVLLNPFWDSQLRIIRDICPFMSDNKIVFYKNSEILPLPVLSAEIESENSLTEEELDELAEIDADELEIDNS